jgi:hypothetical protein
MFPNLAEISTETLGICMSWSDTYYDSETHFRDGTGRKNESYFL